MGGRLAARGVGGRRGKWKIGGRETQAVGAEAARLLRGNVITDLSRL